MKKIITLLILTLYTGLEAQIAIGKENVDGAGILDFPLGTTNGIILPIVETLPSSPTNGTFLMDKNDLKIKMYQNNIWIDMSDPGDITSVNFFLGEEQGEGMIIGNETSVSGILVLEATDKALILPKIENPHLHVKSPYPGMMCYDSYSKTLALFDGLKWNYWK